MRRWWLMWACLGLLILTSRVLAIGEPIRTINDVATVIPSETAFYIVMRTDNEVLEDLNALLGRVADKLALFGVGNIDLEDELRRAVGDFNVDYDDLRAALGDYIAIGFSLEALERFMDMDMDNEGRLPGGVQMYFQVADADAMREIVELEANPTRRSRGPYRLYEGQFVDLLYGLSNEWLIITTDDDLPPLQASLAEQDGYARVMDKLPGQDYGVLMYLSPEAMRVSGQGTMPGMESVVSQHVAFGFAMNDQRHLIMDVVQTLPEDNVMMDALPTAAIDSEFLRHVPEDADLVFQLTDLASYFNYFDVSVNALTPGVNLRRELQTAFNMLNLDLEDDFLSWIDGESVMYSTFDLVEIIENSNQFTRIPFEFGLVIETSDVKASKRFFDILTRQLRRSANREMRVGSAVVNKVSVTLLSFSVPMNNEMLNYEIMMGVTDDVAFIASTEAAQFITAGRGASLLDSADYVEAAELYLPQTKQMLYASDEGVLTMGAVVGAAAVMGSGMEMPGFPRLQAASPRIGYQPGSSTYILELARDVLGAASLTGTVEEGIQITRLVFSLD